MKNLFIFFALMFFTNILFAQNVGINQGGALPDPNAQLHVKSTALLKGIKVNNTNATAMGDSLVGVYSDVAGTGDGQQFGAVNKLINNGTGLQYGTYNELANDITQIHGTFNKLSGSGSSTKYGVYNHLEAANGPQTGLLSYLSTTDNDLIQHGSIQSIVGNGDGIQIGNKNSLLGSGTGNHTGTQNFISALVPVRKKEHIIKSSIQEIVRITELLRRCLAVVREIIMELIMKLEAPVPESNMAVYMRLPIPAIAFRWRLIIPSPVPVQAVIMGCAID